MTGRGDLASYEDPSLQSATLSIAWPGSDFNVLSTNVNWVDLLKDTSWNGGLQPPKP